MGSGGPALEKLMQVILSCRPAWSTDWVSGKPGLHISTKLQSKKIKQKIISLNDSLQENEDVFLFVQLLSEIQAQNNVNSKYYLNV